MGPCRAVITQKEAWRVKTESWRVCRPVIADSHDFDAEQDPALHLKVHKIENFFDSAFGICIISLLVMSKY
jgi:hypothetical protein